MLSPLHAAIGATREVTKRKRCLHSTMRGVVHCNRHRCHASCEPPFPLDPQPIKRPAYATKVYSTRLQSCSRSARARALAPAPAPPSSIHRPAERSPAAAAHPPSTTARPTLRNHLRDQPRGHRPARLAHVEALARLDGQRMVGGAQHLDVVARLHGARLVLDGVGPGEGDGFVCGAVSGRNWGTTGGKRLLERGTTTDGRRRGGVTYRRCAGTSAVCSSPGIPCGGRPPPWSARTWTRGTA